MDNGDGVSLQATAHPKAPWYKSLWLWLFHRDIWESSLEIVTIDTLVPGSPRNLWHFDNAGETVFSDNSRLFEKAAANVFNSTYNVTKPNLGLGFTVSNVQYCQQCKTKTWHNDDVCEWADIVGHKDQK